MGIDAAAGVIVPQAELAVEIAAVGGVYKEIVPVCIGNGKTFFHGYLLLNNHPDGAHPE
jgi:hypothetical protein